MKIRYPSPLKNGDRIGITAPSAGTSPAQHARLDYVLQNLKSQGFEPIEGKCLRKQHKYVSAPKDERAADFLRFWRDPSIKAIMPPWGGEILVEVLPLLDFEDLARHEPKWISGYSDVSTLLFPLTLRTGIATLHGSNLMDLAPTQTDPLTNSLIKTLQLREGGESIQHSVALFQSKFNDFEKQVDAPLNLTDKVEWKALDGSGQKRFSGRMIGGCLDTIARLVGTPYGELPRFTQKFASDGVIFYFENCELSPCEMARTLWNLKLAGWFDGISGMMIGRSAAPDISKDAHLSYVEALRSVLADSKFPILYDVDIGHRPPQFNIINGSLGTVEFEAGRGLLRQRLI